MLSAVIVSATREAEVAGWVQEMTGAMRSHQMRDLHFQKLSPEKKMIACEHVASREVRCFVVASNKQNMRGHKNDAAAWVSQEVNWFYCWMTRVLLERVTHWVHRRSNREFGETKKVKLVFSERGGLSYSQINAYFQWLRFQGRTPFLPLGVIEHDTLDMRLVEIFTHAEHAGLKLPDVVASAFFKAADRWDTGACDPSFALALRPRMASSNGLIAGYGVKLWPGYARLKDKVLPEQREIFARYGYPRQWWQTGGP